MLPTQSAAWMGMIVSVTWVGGLETTHMGGLPLPLTPHMRLLPVTGC